MNVKKETFLVATKLIGAPDKGFSVILYDPNEDPEEDYSGGKYLYASKNQHDTDVIFEAWKHGKTLLIEGDAIPTPTKGVSVFREVWSLEVGQNVDEMELKNILEANNKNAEARD